MKVMIRCEEFEGELTSIREDVIDSLEDGWVVKSVGKINVHHHLHLKDDQSYSSSRLLRWTELFGNISLSPTSNRWLSFSEGGSPSCMMVRIFVISWLSVTIFSCLHFIHLCRTSQRGGSSSVVDAVQRTKCATPHRQHLRTSHPGKKSHMCPFESGWRW